MTAVIRFNMIVLPLCKEKQSIISVFRIDYLRFCDKFLRFIGRVGEPFRIDIDVVCKLCFPLLNGFP